jgi:hypothetical protein
MAFTLALFKKNLRNKYYKNAANALRAVGRGALSEKEKEEAHRLISEHFSVEVEQPNAKPAKPAKSAKTAKPHSLRYDVHGQAIMVVVSKGSKVTIVVS